MCFWQALSCGLGHCAIYRAKHQVSPCPLLPDYPARTAPGRSACTAGVIHP